MALSIEAAPEVRPHVCADCGRSFSSVYGFLYEDGDAHAVYQAVLQSNHPSTVVDIALSFGTWAEEATAADRTRVGVRVWPEEDELKMHINDPGESAWVIQTHLGRSPGGEKSSAHPLSGRRCGRSSSSSPTTAESRITFASRRFG
jgi:hypothetical protein